MQRLFSPFFASSSFLVAGDILKLQSWFRSSSTDLYALSCVWGKSTNKYKEETRCFQKQIPCISRRMLQGVGLADHDQRCRQRIWLSIKGKSNLYAFLLKFTQLSGERDSYIFGKLDNRVFQENFTLQWHRHFGYQMLWNFSQYILLAAFLLDLSLLSGLFIFDEFSLHG